MVFAGPGIKQRGFLPADWLFETFDYEWRERNIAGANTIEEIKQMPGLETAARFLQKMMASELNAIAEFEEDRRLAYTLEEVCRQWASFWSLARQVEDDDQTDVGGLRNSP